MRKNYFLFFFMVSYSVFGMDQETKDRRKKKYDEFANNLSAQPSSCRKETDAAFKTFFKHNPSIQTWNQKLKHSVMYEISQKDWEMLQTKVVDKTKNYEEVKVHAKKIEEIKRKNRLKFIEVVKEIDRYNEQMYITINSANNGVRSYITPQNAYMELADYEPSYALEAIQFFEQCDNTLQDISQVKIIKKQLERKINEINEINERFISENNALNDTISTLQKDKNLLQKEKNDAYQINKTITSKNDKLNSTIETLNEEKKALQKKLQTSNQNLEKKEKKYTELSNDYRKLFDEFNLKSRTLKFYHRHPIFTCSIIAALTLTTDWFLRKSGIRVTPSDV